MKAPGIVLPQADIRGILFYGKRVLRFPFDGSCPMTGVAAGDILWVKEDFAEMPDGSFLRASTGSSAPPPGTVWRPAADMPMHASGLTLVVRRVAATRLFDLDHVALRDEGVFHDDGSDFLSTGSGWGHPGSNERFATAKAAYADYWASTRSACAPDALLETIEIDAVHAGVGRLAAAFARAA